MSCAESLKSGGQSLPTNFSISEICVCKPPETGCVSAETGSNPRRNPAVSSRRSQDPSLAFLQPRSKPSLSRRFRLHIGPDAPTDDKQLITTCVQRIEVRQTEITIALVSRDQDSEDETLDPPVLTATWSKTPHRRFRDVLVPEGSSQAEAHPIRSDARTKLVTAIARGRRGLSEIEAGTVTVEGIAAREACSKRHVHMTISLAFLAPTLVTAAVDGRLPHRVGVARLFCHALRGTVVVLRPQHLVAIRQVRERVVHKFPLFRRGIELLHFQAGLLPCGFV